MERWKVFKIQLILKNNKTLSFRRREIVNFQIQEKISTKIKNSAMYIHRVSIAEIKLYKDKSEHANFLSLSTDVQWIYIHYDLNRIRKIEKIYIPWGENDGNDATESSLQKIIDNNPRNISWTSVL